MQAPKSAVRRSDIGTTTDQQTPIAKALAPAFAQAGMKPGQCLMRWSPDMVPWLGRRFLAITHATWLALGLGSIFGFCLAAAIFTA